MPAIASEVFQTIIYALPGSQRQIKLAAVRLWTQELLLASVAACYKTPALDWSREN